MKYQVIIVGGGLAGLVSAIDLSQQNVKVLLIEKYKYPKHKVCGEYISNEVLPYLFKLGYNPFDFGAKNINQLTFSTVSNASVSTPLPLGGFGISRYSIDATLAELAISFGAEIIHDTVTDIHFENEKFIITTITNNNYRSDVTIGAYGKRSNIDKKLSRSFIKKSSPYLSVKAHYKGSFPDNKVSLHTFDGGYCGLSKVETDHINVCYITDYNSFKKYKNIEDFQKQVVSQNKQLAKVLESLEMVFEKPLTISQVSFSSKKLVENHILMCGDSAGMIHPLAGNGMSMAIRSGQMASNLIGEFISGKIASRQQLEEKYMHTWRGEFQSRLNAGHIIAKLFKNNFLSNIIVSILKLCPRLLSYIIRRTHGKPMTV